MDKKRLDEAVEVARLAYEVEVDGQVYSPNVPAEAMRAALLASLPVLLGDARPAILCVDSDRVALVDKHDEFPSAAFKNVWVVDCYAPSLGEGE